MTNGQSTTILWIGSEDIEAFHRLREDLQASGLELAVPAPNQNLRSVLRDLSRLVVVFNENGDEAEEVFNALRSQYRPIPIVVLTAMPSCGDYYRLAGVGPTYFCTQLDTPEPIQRAIRRAAADAA